MEKVEQVNPPRNQDDIAHRMAWWLFNHLLGRLSNWLILGVTFAGSFIAVPTLGGKEGVFVIFVGALLIKFTTIAEVKWSEWWHHPDNSVRNWFHRNVHARFTR